MIGGLEQIAKTLATEFSKSGHDVVVVTDAKPNMAVEDDQFKFDVVRACSSFKRYSVFSESDIILFMNVSLVGFVPAFFSRKPLVFCHQGIYGTKDFGWKVFGLELIKGTLTKFFPNIAASQFVANRLPGVAIHIPNAYDDQLFGRNAEILQSLDFVFCGRLVSDKGGQVAIDAFAKVRRRFPVVSLTIIGEGPERSALEEQAESLGLKESVRFTGALRGEALVMALQTHGCMLVPSLWEEPFGIVALEGMACGNWVIASNRGGLPEAVGVGGECVPPTVEAFAIAMERYVDRARCADEVEKRNMEQKAECHLRNHRAEPVARRYLDALFNAVKI